MEGSDVSVSTADAVAMLIARFRDREATDFETYFKFLVEPAKGAAVEPEIIEFLGAALLENMRSFLTFLSHDISIDNVDAPLMTLEYVRRLAQSEVGISAVIDPLRAMNKKVLELMISEIRQSGLTRDTALDVLGFFFDRASSYVDRMTRQLGEVHEAERKRSLERQNSARALGIRRLLADDEHIDIDAATSTIGYPLGGTHLAMILSTTEPGAHEPDMLRVERLVHEVAEALNIGTPLFIAADRTTGWAWLPLEAGTADPIAEVRRIADAGDGAIRIAMGPIGSGVAGFRVSHRQAQDARKVAVAGHTSRRVVTVADPEVRVAALMVDDLDRTRQWVHNTLGPLASNTTGDAKLRETLRTFLRAGSSHTAAAEQLGLHRNTVGYRVNKAVERRGRPITDDQIEVEMALLACDQFHEAVLQEAVAT